MTTKLRKHLSIIFMLASTAFLTLSGIWVYSLYQKAFKDNHEVIETYQTIRAVNRILLSVNDAALDVSSFIITNDKKFTSNLPNIIISIQLNLSTLLQLIHDNPTEIIIYQKLNSVINNKIEFLRSIIKLNSLQNKNSFISNPKRLELTTTINQLIEEIKNIEIGQLEEETIKCQASMNIAKKAFILLGTLNILFSIISFILAEQFLHARK